MIFLDALYLNDFNTILTSDKAAASSSRKEDSYPQE